MTDRPGLPSIYSRSVTRQTICPASSMSRDAATKSPRVPIRRCSSWKVDGCRTKKRLTRTSPRDGRPPLHYSSRANTGSRVRVWAVRRVSRAAVAPPPNGRAAGRDTSRAWLHSNPASHRVGKARVGRVYLLPHRRRRLGRTRSRTPAYLTARSSPPQAAVDTPGTPPGRG